MSIFSFGQTTAAPIFNEAGYTEVSRGADTVEFSDRYAIYYRNTQNSSYTLKKIYLDSSFTQIVSTGFYKDGVLEGPFVIYNNRAIALQGMYKNGQWDGERFTFINEQVVQKAIFSDGRKVGKWEEYHPVNGRLLREITFDGQGEIVSDVRH